MRRRWGQNLRRFIFVLCQGVNLFLLNRPLDVVGRHVTLLALSMIVLSLGITVGITAADAGGPTVIS